MQICYNKNCPCTKHRRLLYCIKIGFNEEAISIQQQLQDIHELIDTGVSTLFLLHYAVNCNNAKVVQHLINVGYIIDAHDNSCGDSTPLMLAIKQANLTMTEILLDNHADIYKTDRHGVNSVEYAVEHLFDRIHDFQNTSKYHILAVLFEQVNKDFFMDKGEAMLLLDNAKKDTLLAAMVFGSIELTKFVLKKINVDIRQDYSDCTALHWALILSRIDIAKVLIEHGASVEALDSSNFSPLYYYLTMKCEQESSYVLKSLLKRSAKSYVVHHFGGKTEMDWLLMFGNTKTVRIALLICKDVRACLSNEGNFLQALIINKNDDVLDVIDELNISFDVNERNDGKTLLMLAISHGCLKKVDWLLKRGADVNLFTPTEHTALYYALTSLESFPSNMVSEMTDKFTAIIKSLLLHGADAQLGFNNETTLISYSFYDENQDFAEALLAHLAVLHTSDKSMLTELTHKELESKPMFKTRFNFYLEQLKKIKNIVLYGTITLLKILTESDQKLMGYVRNQELISKFNAEMKKKFYATYYYSDDLHRRMKNTKNKADLVEKAASVIGKLSKLHLSIACRITKYVAYQDLNTLCKLENIINE